MNSFGDTIRKLRKEKELPLRTVAAYMDIDQAILSKIERGHRKATREQVIKFAAYFKVIENDLIIEWLSGKLVYELKDEQVALKALHVAEQKVTYKAYKKTDRNTIIKKIKEYFVKDGRVSSAWLFGSFARGENDYKSDIDVMIEMKNSKSYSLFDFLDIQYNLENLVHRKIDLVEKGHIKPFAWKTVKNDLMSIL